MPRRTTAADPTPVRVVIVTMDSHLASATERARRALVRNLPGLSLSVHAAAEWGDDPTALARCVADIARGDIIIATMLFMEDHFQPVLAGLKARREHCDAMVCAMSASEVMKLTRMGRFCMDAPVSGPMALLKRLRGKPSAEGDEQSVKANAGARQMKMLRRIPRLLLHSRHSAGRARLFPHPPVLAGRVRGECGEHGALPDSIATPTDRGAPCVAG